ncbi:galectin-2-like isoform 2-T3 [Synchiropus picturatus]
MSLELSGVNLSIGDQLKIKGEVPSDAERFQIDLGHNVHDLALHFNPRFHDDVDGAVLVCNSKSSGCWGEEVRDLHNPLQRGTSVKIVLKVAGDWFEVLLPDGHEVRFPNRQDVDIISYVKVTGDFKLSSLKIC